MIRLRPINILEASTQGFNRCVKQESAHCISWVGQPESRFTFDHVASEYITQARWTFWSHEFYVLQSCEHVCVCVPEERESSINWCMCYWLLKNSGDLQEKLFTVAGLPMVENCMAGYNSCMFCYGQVSQACWRCFQSLCYAHKDQRLPASAGDCMMGCTCMC